MPSMKTEKRKGNIPFPTCEDLLKNHGYKVEQTRDIGNGSCWGLVMVPASHVSSEEEAIFKRYWSFLNLFCFFTRSNVQESVWVCFVFKVAHFAYDNFGSFLIFFLFSPLSFLK